MHLANSQRIYIYILYIYICLQALKGVTKFDGKGLVRQMGRKISHLGFQITDDLIAWISKKSLGPGKEARESMKKGCHCKMYLWRV